METANAFDVLILPILQCFAWMMATFPILHGLRVGIGNLIRQPRRAEAGHASR
jgi:hypothetical protein